LGRRQTFGYKTGEDFFGRTLAFVVVDGVNVSQAMIQNGYAWHYKKYSKDETLAAFEVEARTANRVLWLKKFVS
jgi:micrococcal nuclease